MKQFLQNLREQRWLMLLVLLGWLLPQQAVADDGYDTFVDQSYMYNIYVSGSNTVTISVPLYDQEGADCYIVDGNLYASWEGQSEINLFHWALNGGSIAGDKSTCPTMIYSQAPGYFNVTLGNTTGVTRLDPHDWKPVNVARNSDGTTFSLSAVWVFPKELLGKNVKLRWHVQRDGTGRNKVWLDESAGLKQPDPITLPEANPVSPPVVTLATLNNDSTGRILVPWTMLPEKINKLHYEYNDANGRLVSVSMPTTTNGGTISLNAFEPHRNFRIIADYYEAQTVGDYLIKDAASEPQDLTMIHAPSGLTARPLGGANSKVELKWNVGNITDEDVAEIDFFEIQRSLTGKEEDFVTIGQEPFAKLGEDTKTVYTFVDSTYVDAITEEMLTDGYTLENLTYRVRRTITQGWGWGTDNPCASTAKCVMDNLHLLRIADYTATKVDDSYNVRVAWQYADEHNGVWDSRAKMMLRVTSLNLAGDTVEVKDVQLTEEDRTKCYKVVNLTRPCLKYKIELYVDRGTSPISLYDKSKMKEYFYAIRNVDDWKTFRDKVQAAKGEYDVNARLYADISTSISIGWESDRPYRGVFDGNGHTLTFNMELNENYCAPFRHVTNATIQNLHVTGTIKTKAQYAGGLVGYILNDNSALIENCQSSMTINTTNFTNGGFISRLGDRSTVILRNCKFDGSFEGAESHHNGGFIGYRQSESSTTIDNCLFAPDHINTGVESCETWARGASDATLNVINSYATMEYSSLLTIRNASDWHMFAVMVNEAVNKYDVNAVLAADITVSEHVGVTEGAMYHGTFNGNGHTITFNKDWKPTTDDRFIALFRHVGNATIKNLHVKGTVEFNRMYPAGIAAQVKDGTATIENCQSSVTLKGTMNGEGTLAGLVGRVSNASVVIRNSKFDGRFEGANCYGNGGFISWVDEKSKATIENCFFAPAAINTKYDKCKTWARQDDRGTVTVTNCHSTMDYGVFIIRNSADWDTFCDMITSANNAYWVDAALAADISITKSAASSRPWRGTFDGNGHTITVNIDGGTNYNIALFRSTSNHTIKNLHVKGNIKGGPYVAGLVGTTYGNNNTITNCRVSANLDYYSTSDKEYAGGFVGNGERTPQVITNCLFDGSIAGDRLDYAAAFISWQENQGNQITGNAFNNNLENASSYPISSSAVFSRDAILGMNFILSGAGESPAWANGRYGSNNWTYHAVEERSSTDLHNHKCWEEAHQVGNKSASDLVAQLGGSNWQVDSEGKVVPKMFDNYSTNPWYNGSITASQQVEALGKDNWHVVDGKAVPKAKIATETTDEDALANLGTWTKVGDTVVPTTTTVAEPNYATITPPTLDDFYHTSTGVIDKELVVEKHQSSVVLTWNTDGNPIDYFTVMRREVLAQGYGAWENVSPNIDQMTYEDKTVSPLKTYQYKVRATADCEGEHFSYTDSIIGACKNTGRLEGYVRFNDGTGIANAVVNIVGGSVELSAETDERGHYVADELPYQGTTRITYSVTLGSGLEAENNSYSVTFDDKINDVTVHELTVINGKRFSGHVTYEGTSIPVKGANFLVNGKLLHGATGKVVETDDEGAFSFRVIPDDNTIQVVKDGHKFVNNGWYKGPKGHYFSGDVADILFQDSTKVKLIGRVVGGNDQGKLPLANNLSKNNLGDNLKMVLTLEGDSKSWLVYDNLNRERTERDTVYLHTGNGDHKTVVKTMRKRMEVTPDPATGEYMLMLPPVRWKVQQVYCTGYPTLFQEGQASEVIDLTKSLTEKDTTYVGSYMDVDGNTISKPRATYNHVYNRIYRSPIQLTYKQLGYDSFDYFGDKNYNSSNLKGERAVVPLAYKNPADTTKALYTFDYPVFSLERKYNIQVQVAESYPYNNDLTSERIDYVKIGGGVATMHNGMKNGVAVDTLHLDDQGQAVFMVQADHTMQPLGTENALKTVTFSAEQDGSHYTAEPLRGYVLNMYPLGKSKDLLVEGQPLLFDILRDPPGAYSSATLAKGATLNSSYMMNIAMSGGVIFSFTLADKPTWFAGDNLGEYFGAVAGHYGGTFYGIDHSAEKVDISYTDLVFNYNGSKAWSYTMAIGQNISTSGDPSMVGADADLYIGMVQNVQVTPMSTIRAITDEMYQTMLARLGVGQVNTTGEVTQYAKYGTLVHIAEGVDANGKKFHLVRDLSIAHGPKIKSNFIYSQKQILEEVIPGKVKEIMDLLFTGTREEATQVANSTGKPVYLSLRQPTDPKFAYKNTTYNTDCFVANDTTHYVIILPSGKTMSDFPDEITEKSEIMYAWAKMIAQNEREKLNATDLIGNYDIAGAQGINYSETFDSNYSNSTSMYFPWGKQPDYFAGKGSGIGTTAATTIVNYGLGALFGYLESLKKLDPSIDKKGSSIDKDTGTNTSLKFNGTYFRWALLPVLTSQIVGTNGIANAYNRTESFTIAPGPTSRLNVDVYRVPMANTTVIENGKNPDDEFGNYNYNTTHGVDPEDIFSNYNFNGLTADAVAYLKDNSNAPDHGGPCSFVYRTRGGYTANPWEDQRKTKFYQAGSILDERTLKIDNPTISLDKHSVSGVSVNDPARFTVFLANESEKPEATNGLSTYQLFSVDQANVNGAKLSVNGQTLTTGGMTVSLVPGMTTQLELEVRPGKGYDYEGLTLGLMSPTDPEHAVATTQFDVHFLREAGAVNISVPADKWVLNTSAQQDPDRGWYLPVVINGFDRHQQNFDHIEFQYKESQRGDDAWTNLCSFYADSTLMADANGVCKLMEPNGNITTEFFGEGTVIERTYDLRAVLFCRNGGTYLTTASKVISGIKDTRRPQLFGTPEPKSGLLTRGDNIVFNFSEDIEYNNLSAITNFEVKGEVNNNDLSEMVSLQFTGQASAESDAKRNFSGKDLTIDLRIKPDTLEQRDMPLFSHGTNGQKLQLWFTKDYKLRAVINDQTFTSETAIKPNAFRQVAVSIDQTNGTLKFFCDGKVIGSGYKLEGQYTGTGPLIFGRTNELSRETSQYYKGRMMEARLWYSALNVGQFSTYGLHRLSGYEKDLVDYYPMNEGSGEYATDYTQGANARLIGTSWAMPHGMSLSLEKSDNGLEMTQDALNRTIDQDYTLMFWFKTDAAGRGTLLSNGSGLKDGSDAKNQFNIGFDGDKLMYRSNGFATHVAGDWSDNQWHHYAMTVNRGRNVVNIYMDRVLRTTFAADSLGGISGSSYIGVTPGGITPLKGYMDELILFAQALPQQLINVYSMKSPNGDEAGLLTYLGFDHQERNQENEIVLTPYVYSKKIYLDAEGKVRYQQDPVTMEFTNVPARDYLFKDKVDKIVAHIDATVSAPVVPFEEVTGLNYSFIGRGNQIMIELDEPAVKLNHRHVYVTLRDVEDRNGNTMASPQTACYYVVNGSLQWVVNRLNYTIKYGKGEDAGEELQLPFYNNGSASHTYTIENCPKWLTLDKYTDVIAPLGVDGVVAKVSKDLNIGTYNEILYLVDEDGIVEPFYLNLTIEGDQPDWASSVSGDLLKNSMSISGLVYLYGELDTDERDIVGAFDNEGVCHGFANISHNTKTGETGLYLTVYDSQANGRPLSFRLWQYSTGREIVLTTTPAITFAKDAILGTDIPVRFDGSEAFIQNFKLQAGWNWVSFNVNSSQLSNVNSLLSSMRWNDGDVLTELGSDLTMTYEEDKKMWVASGSTKGVVISPKMSYAIKVKEPCTFPIGGTIIKNEDDRTITVSKGWNAIGYTPMANLTVEAALTDYFDNAESGDVIKSHTEFAYFTKSGSTGRWRGSLQYMKPGEGYMLLRKGEGEVSFTYPFYELGSFFIADKPADATSSAAPRHRSTMNVSAVVEGIETEAGDALIAYSNGEEVGNVVINSESSDVNYLNIAGDNQSPIWFAIERDGEIIASTPEIMTFKTNAVVGSPDEPTAINFVRTEYEKDGKWYTISGLPLQKKPVLRGIYIFNGKKVVIK